MAASKIEVTLADHLRFLVIVPGLYKVVNHRSRQDKGAERLTIESGLEMHEQFQ
jgi:hypothetical protein